MVVSMTRQTRVGDTAFFITFFFIVENAERLMGEQSSMCFLVDWIP